jgi:pyruvate/2-oxoglutarate dehydrogenase complex dihydrolipoamide acyltransferase (E2) component
VDGAAGADGVDGADGARLMTAFKQYVESPMAMLA